MNSICFFKDEIIDQKQILLQDEKRLGHINTHLKSKVSDIVTITILDQGIYKAKIVELDLSKCVLEITEQTAHKEPWFHLLIGLSRPQTIKKVLEHSTTLGAASFNLFKAQLSEKSYSQSKIYENSKFQTYMIDGLAQSKVYSQLPDFSLSNYLNIDRFKDHKNKYFLSLNTTDTFKDMSSNDLQNPLLAIGPERGWTKKEETLLLEAGFSPIKISQSVLRVEHAIYTSVGQLEMLRL
mgnify:CR=1 FL=1